ncbi:MAG: hypothetical protein HQL34_08635 [Alphaproteobacteria bacterium]|nr:hypothetical protein [Alphaproteobacteria bacterium]
MLSHLMQTSVRVHSANTNYDVPVGELIMTALGRKETSLLQPETAKGELLRTGIRLHEDGFFVSTSHIALKRIFKGTTWEANWRVPMGRISGAVKSPKTIRFGLGASDRAIWVPLAAVSGDGDE